MSVRLGFEVAASHRFVFQYMMSRTKNILLLDNKCVKQLVDVARKPGGGAAGFPVVKLVKWNFKLVFYYVKLC